MIKMKEGMNNNQHIAVYVRCRPLNTNEKKVASFSVIDANVERREVIVKERALQKTFTFDRVFDPKASQVDVYKAVVSPLLKEVLMGFSCTVFAYGQTGTGKTYTMEGERSENLNVSWEDDPLSGIVPRAMHHLFENLREQELDYSLKVSFLELYNEELFDLLGPIDDNSKLRLYEDPSRKGSVIVSGIEEVSVHSRDEVYNILKRGAEKRQTAATLMNANSSRSHTIFSITVHIKDNTMDGDELMKIGKLNLVDLAGSENIGRSGAVDKRAREAGNINQSLLTLGRVITALVERSPHIPYRESKLTRLLQDSLGGKTKTSIIATISPASINIEETLSTLEYAHRAKNITNKPEANEKLTKKTLIKQYTEEIERLKRELAATREKNGVFLDPETYSQLNSNIEIKDDEIKDLTEKIKALTEERNKINELFAETKDKLFNTEQSLNQTKEYLSDTVKVLHKTAQDRDERNVLLNANVKTVNSLTRQGKQLIKVATIATSDVDKLHNKVETFKSTENHNDAQLQHFKECLQQQAWKNFTNEILEHDRIQQKIHIDMAAEYDLQLKNHTGYGNSLRDLITSSVNTLTSKLSELDNLSTQNVDSSLKSVESSVEYFKTFKDELIGSIKNVVCDELVPKFISALNLISQKETSLTELRDTVIAKMQQQYSAAQLHTKKQLKELSDLREELDKLYEFHRESNESLNAYTNSMQNSSNLIKKNFKDEMEINVKAMHDMVDQMNSFMQAAYQSQESNQNSLIDEVNHKCKMTKEYDTSSQTKTAQFDTNIVKGFKDYDDQSSSWNNEAISTFSETMNENISLNSRLKEETEGAQQKVVSLQSQIQETIDLKYGMMENISKAHITTLTNYKTSHNELTQEMIEIETGCAKDSDAMLNSQQQEFSTDISVKQQLNEKYRSAQSDWTNKTVSVIQQRDSDLDRFTSSFQKVVSTGTTPGRRDFTYPNELAKTSPHEHLIQRFRSYTNQKIALSVPLPEDDSFDDIPSAFNEGGNCDKHNNSCLTSCSSKECLAQTSDEELKENHIVSNSTEFKKPKQQKEITSNIPKVKKRPLRAKNSGLSS